MTGSGLLCHEGSSPPQSKPSQPRPLDSSLVLDIAGLAAVSDNRFVLCRAFKLIATDVTVIYQHFTRDLKNAELSKNTFFFKLACCVK